MINYEEKMLLLLVEKYRKSKKDSGTGRINRRTQIKPMELYRGYNRNDGDLEQINAINETAGKYREKGFLTFEMRKFSNEISSYDIFLCQSMGALKFRDSLIKKKNQNPKKFSSLITYV